MQIRQLPIALLIASIFPLVTEARADSIWQGSYSVEGQCFCSGEISSSIATKIVPTPIGGQTVEQVCAKLGEGPGLLKQGGKFNYPVFKDPQCGHGPFNSAKGPRDPDCVGTIDGTYGSCQPAGPRWSLTQAYALPGASTPVNAEQTRVVSSEKADVPAAALPAADSVTTDTSGVKSPSAGKSTKRTELDKTGALSSDPALAGFTGKSLKMGNDTFLQARDGAPAKGGAAGSRIIVDGILYIRHDKELNIAELYQEEKSPKVAAAEPVKKAVAESESKPVSETSVADALKSARLKKAQKEREEQARAEYRAEQKARDARLTSQQENAVELTQAQQQADKKAQLQAKMQAEMQAMREQKLQAEIDAKQEESRLAEIKARQQEVLKAQLQADMQAKREQKLQAEIQASQEESQQAQMQARQQEKLKAQMQADMQAKREAELKAEQAAQMDDERPAKSASDRNALSEASKQSVATGTESESDASKSAVLSALRLPAGARASSRNFAYVEAMPASYHIGGGGVILEGSAQSNARYQYVGRVGVADTYSEVMVGGGYFITPSSANRMTVVLMAGIEFGSFELRNEALAPGVTIKSSDNGLYLGVMSRFVVNGKFELKGGVGYSTFFEGDATLFAGAYYHVTPRLDVMSRFELGDNDQLGIGIRYYY